MRQVEGEVNRSYKVQDLIANLYALQQACLANARSAIEEAARSCDEAASRLTVADVAECGRESLARLRHVAVTTEAFTRRAVRDRGVRLTTLRFRQVECGKETSGISA